MTIEQIAKLIGEKGYLFQVSIPNNVNFTQGKTTIDQALADSPSLEDYFRKIADRNHAKNMLVKTFSPNGSSFRHRGDHLIFLDNTQAVATENKSATNVAQTFTPVATNPLNGLETKPHHETMDIAKQLELGVLKVQHNMIVQRKDELEEEVKQLRKKNEQLQDQLLEATKQNAVANERHQLEVDKAKFEITQGSKGSLEGITDFANQNPEIVKMVLAGLFPNNPAFNNNGQQQIGSAEAEKRYHADNDADFILKNIPAVLSKLDAKQIERMYAVLEHIVNHPKNIDILYNKIYNPKQPANQNGTNGTDPDPEDE